MGRKALAMRISTGLLLSWYSCLLSSGRARRKGKDLSTEGLKSGHVCRYHRARATKHQNKSISLRQHNGLDATEFVHSFDQGSLGHWWLCLRLAKKWVRISLGAEE
jgi:hypothetical protein